MPAVKEDRIGAALGVITLEAKYSLEALTCLHKRMAKSPDCLLKACGFHSVDRNHILWVYYR